MARFRLKNTGPRNGGFAGLIGCVLVLIVFLALPGYAIQRLGLELRWVAAYVAVLNLLTYWTYAWDKRRAKNDEWRIPEARLHFLELLGGWPGAFLAQRRLRHKCSKTSYQFTFWLIVFLWQFVAFDSLQNWNYSRAVLDWVEHHSKRER